MLNVVYADALTVILKKHKGEAPIDNDNSENNLTYAIPPKRFLGRLGSDTPRSIGGWAGDIGVGFSDTAVVLSPLPCERKCALRLPTRTGSCWNYESKMHFSNIFFSWILRYFT